MAEPPQPEDRRTFLPPADARQEVGVTGAVIPPVAVELPETGAVLDAAAVGLADAPVGEDGGPAVFDVLPHALLLPVAPGQPVVVEPIAAAGRVDGEEPVPVLPVLRLAGRPVDAAVLELGAAGSALVVVEGRAVQEPSHGLEVAQGLQGDLDRRKMD